LAVQALVPKYNSFIAGSADLLESTFVNFDGQVEFQNVSTMAAGFRLNMVANFFRTSVLHSPPLVWEIIPVDSYDTGSENLPWSV
jgi:hypothetical protein